MRLQNFTLENFRNYSTAEVKFNPNANLLIGQNGQGKTNLLEAIHLALTGRTIRYAKNEDLKNSNTIQDFFRIDASIESDEMIFTSSTIFKQGHLARLVNEKRVSTARLAELFNVVLFTPDSLNIIKGGASERRDLVDDLWIASKPKSSQVISDYARCLKSRNKLLKDAASGQLNSKIAADILISINASFLPLAAEVISGRLSAIKTILPLVKTVAKTLFNSANVDISVDYVISKKSAVDWSKNQVYDALKLRMDELKEAELHSGTSLVGPHKNEINFYLNQKDARFYGSQGQQRAIILAFKVAQIELCRQEKGQLPLLLLDDVFSELDLERRGQLLEILLEIPAQIFLTSTDLGTEKLFEPKDVTVYRVDKGNVNI